MLKGRVLLGWMPRDAAVAFLRTECNFNPPLSESQAEALWLRYRERVETLAPRSRPSPEPLPMSAAEREHAARFLEYAASVGLKEVLDVVKLDLGRLELVQFFVCVERAEEIARAQPDAADWMERFLPLAPRSSTARVSYRRDGPHDSVIEFELPHAEFAFQPDPLLPSRFMLVEYLHHAAVTRVGDRALLKAGYHRAYARRLVAGPKRPAPALLALVANDGSAEPGDPLAPLRGRAPRVDDFDDDELALTVDLVRHRFQLRVVARLSPLEERRKSPRGSAKARAEGGTNKKAGKSLLPN